MDLLDNDGQVCYTSVSLVKGIKKAGLPCPTDHCYLQEDAIMKKFTSIILTIATILSITTSAFAAGTPAPYTREVTLRGSVDITVNGNEQALKDANGNVVLPIFFDGTHYLPLRALAGIAGLNVDWNNATRTVMLTTGGTMTTQDGTVNKSDSQINAVISPDVTVTLDGVAQTFADAAGTSVYPVIYNGTTYLPVRAVAELVGLNIEWIGSTKTVAITTETETTTSTAFGNIPAIPAGNIAAVPGTSNKEDLSYFRWLTEDECEAMGVENGVIYDVGASKSMYGMYGVWFEGVSYTSFTCSIVAPSDARVKYNMGGQNSKWDDVVGITGKIPAGTVETLTVPVTGYSAVGVGGSCSTNGVIYIVNISFTK